MNDSEPQMKDIQISNLRQIMSPLLTCIHDALASVMPKINVELDGEMGILDR